MQAEQKVLCKSALNNKIFKASHKRDDSASTTKRNPKQLLPISLHDNTYIFI